MKKLITIMIVIFLIVTPGCAETKNGQTANKKPPVTRQETNSNKGPAQNQAPQVKKYPAEVQNWIEILKPIHAGSFLESGGKTYIVVSWGLKNTDGYMVEKEDLKDSGDRVRLTVRFKEPRGAAKPVFTTPYLVETVNHHVKEVDFVSTEKNGYIPVIRHLPKALPFINETTNIKIMEFNYKENGINITGLARVFEATLEYEIQDINRKPLKKGVITTYGGAPDWGYFKISENYIPPGATYVEIFDSSPKDGHKENIVTLEIRE